MNIFTYMALIDLGICAAVGLGLFWTHNPSVLWALLLILWVGNGWRSRPAHATCPKCNHFFKVEAPKDDQDDE